ncbi:MAG: bacteriophage Gp15 family protein [Oscillospiraceae bacterium]|nr:bacteriophage Gp15 family protein [Oscillospiraceae bacterium]
MRWSVTNGFLPAAYEYGDRVYELQTDFRDWIRFDLLLTDPDICIGEKAEKLKEIIFPVVPDDDNIMDFIMWFYNCGETRQQSGEKNQTAKKQSPVYSYEHDFGYIFAAFMELYGIDLVSVPYLHWWKFKALFASLHDCKFTDIVGYRSERITSKTPEYRKQFLKDMKKTYALPHSLSEQQKIDELKMMKEKMGY